MAVGSGSDPISSRACTQHTQHNLGSVAVGGCDDHKILQKDYRLSALVWSSPVNQLPVHITARAQFIRVTTVTLYLFYRDSDSSSIEGVSCK